MSLLSKKKHQITRQASSPHPPAARGKNIPLQKTAYSIALLFFLMIGFIILYTLFYGL